MIVAQGTQHYVDEMARKGIKPLPDKDGNIPVETVDVEAGPGGKVKKVPAKPTPAPATPDVAPGAPADGAKVDAAGDQEGGDAEG